MGFNASAINTRYSQSGNIPVLKEDFTKIAADLIAMQTFMNTATGQEGKFTTLFATSLTASGAVAASGALSGASLTIAGSAWPAGILLSQINTGGRASATNGKWATLFLDDTTVPGTNITLRHLKQAGSSFTFSNLESFSNGFNSASTGERRTIPTGIGLDGGNNFKFWLWGQTTAVGGSSLGSTDLAVEIGFGSKVISGVTNHVPILTFFGSNATGATVTLTTVMKVYDIQDA